MSKIKRMDEKGEEATRTLLLQWKGINKKPQLHTTTWMNLANKTDKKKSDTKNIHYSIQVHLNKIQKAGKTNVRCSSLASRYLLRRRRLVTGKGLTGMDASHVLFLAVLSWSAYLHMPYSSRSLFLWKLLKSYSN